MRSACTKGEVFLAGAGPGDPDLLTVRTLRLLQSCDVIIYDRLVSAEILALASSAAEFIYAGKDEGHQEQMQGEIFRLLVDRAGVQGKRVLRLKGGDPFVFGRGAEEMELLRSLDIPVEVVPGVSSALAGPASAGIPVTYRGTSRSVTIVSARCKGGTEADWSKVAGSDTLVILMGVKNRGAIARALMACGRKHDEPAAFIEKACTPDQRVIETDLGAIAAGTVEVAAPAVFVVGEVVRLRSALMPAVTGALHAAAA